MAYALALGASGSNPVGVRLSPPAFQKGSARQAGFPQGIGSSSLPLGKKTTPMKTVIGIIGPIGSGKDTAAIYLAEKLGCKVYEISGHIKKLAHEQGILHDRQSLIDFGNRIVKERGSEYLPNALLEQISERGIITGMRQVAQIEYLQKHSNLILVAIDADPEIRFKRAQARGRLGEATTIEEFVRLEKEENSGDRVQRIFECMKMADHSVTNNGTLEELQKALDDLAKFQ
ncbi:MAG: hypothetical protein UY52_C0007G0021 [Parcubacteria group bacterium GW2011_GWC2_49_9]|nr:MAG: hypothetical protein UY34_C0010G0009 [Parcubacteria group bacterium GW2011_GWA2_48_9]KKW16261.1 MAG: hypothetical protein UY52_C0007G0021 [Parcubacteria group bacterium GW2011_GWC2_49_9]